MKSMNQKRKEALVRLEASVYENSKAKRLGTATKAEWEANKELQLAKLGANYHG